MNKIAVTLYGSNTLGFPEDYPKEARENAKELLAGEDMLFESIADYKAWVERNWADFVAPASKEEMLSQIAEEKQTRVEINLGASVDIRLSLIEEAQLILGNKQASPEDLKRLDEIQAFQSKARAIRVYADSLIATVERGEKPEINSGWPSM